MAESASECRDCPPDDWREAASVLSTSVSGLQGVRLLFFESCELHMDSPNEAMAILNVTRR